MFGFRWIAVLLLATAVASSAYPTQAPEPAQAAVNNAATTNAVASVHLLRIEQHPEGALTRVVIVLDRMGPFRSAMLHNPDRVYFDLEGARPAPKPQALTAGAADTLVSKIVVAEHAPNITRVVIHLRAPVSYRVTESQAPIGIAVALIPAEATASASGPIPRLIAPVAVPRPRTPAPAAGSEQKSNIVEPRGQAAVSRRGAAGLPVIPAPGLPSPDMLIPMLTLADRGNADAEASIGYLHDSGRFGPTHYEQAAEWYERAAAQGHVFSMVRLAAMYAKGIGVDQDSSRANYWYARAEARTGIPASRLKLLFREFEPTPGGKGKDTLASSTPPPHIRAAEPLPEAVQPKSVEPQQAAGVPAAEPPKTVEPRIVVVVPAPPSSEPAQPAALSLPEHIPSLSIDDVMRLPLHRPFLDLPAVAVAVVSAPTAPSFAVAPPGAPLRSLDFDPALAPKEPARALAYFRKAAEDGVPAAQFSLAGMYFDGQGVPKNLKEAARWYEAAAKQGHSRAQSNLGLMYLNGWGVEKSVRQSVVWFRKAAEQGDAVGQSNLGAAYVNGTGVLVDSAAGAAWLRKAAEQGVAEAQYGLATLYVNGRGVPVDLNSAALWLQRAAAQQFPKAQLVLGQMYVNGQITDPGHEGVRFIEAAANSGLADAPLALAKMYRDGRGVSASSTLALNWFLKSADLNSGEAQYAVGEMYRDGKGVPKDVVMAYAWFALAAANHYKGGLPALNALSPVMTMAQLTAGQQRAYALMMKILQARSATPLPVWAQP